MKFYSSSNPIVYNMEHKSSRAFISTNKSKTTVLKQVSQHAHIKKYYQNNAEKSTNISQHARDKKY